MVRFRGLCIQSVTSLHPSRSFALFLPLCKKQRQRIEISFQTSCLHTARTLGPDPSSAGSSKQGQRGLFAGLWLETTVMVLQLLDVFAFMFIKCRCFKAGSAGKSFCSETGLSELSRLSPSQTPASLYAVAGFCCFKYVRLLFPTEHNAVVCRGARRAEQKTVWRVREKEKEIESVSQVHLCMFLSLPLCFPILPGRQS